MYWYLQKINRAISVCNLYSKRYSSTRTIYLIDNHLDYTKRLTGYLFGKCYLLYVCLVFFCILKHFTSLGKCLTSDLINAILCYKSNKQQYCLEMEKYNIILARNFVSLSFYTILFSLPELTICYFLFRFFNEQFPIQKVKRKNPLNVMLLEVCIISKFKKNSDFSVCNSISRDFHVCF